MGAHLQQSIDNEPIIILAINTQVGFYNTLI